eukprot:12582953-Alexandrium_andersonii.AAC.1
MAGLPAVVVLHFESRTHYGEDECLAQCACSQSTVEQGDSDAARGIRSTDVCPALWNRLSGLAWCVLEWSC